MTGHLIEVKKSVSFIFIKNKDGALIPNGTGFFVGVKHENNEQVMTSYFVTAKHVLQDGSGCYYPEFFIRLNRLEGDSEFFTFVTANLKIIEHSDKSVDIAVFEYLPTVGIYDFKCIPHSLIADKELIKQHEICEGDDVFFAGLFTPHYGAKKNQPIIRFGKVALITDEKILWQVNNQPSYQDLYLLECQSFGGNSGSPVFFELNPLRKSGAITLGPRQFFLAGVMTGTFLDAKETQRIKATDNDKFIAFQTVGIAAVTPSEKLKDILFSEELVKKRMEYKGNETAP